MIKKVFETESRRKLNREFRLRRRRVMRAGEEMEALADKHFFLRLNQITGIRRFLVSWLALAILLILGVSWQVMSLGRYYLSFQPSSGGTYREGVLGSFTNANPIYATGLADNSVSALVFSGLLTYDRENKLTGDLAEKWELSDNGKRYTVTLKPDLKWQDGKPLTAKDVAFTFHTIQDANARSPLFRNWQGVTVTAEDDRTITFALSSALTGFEYSLTTGILPQHLLGEIDAEQLRSLDFNTIRPVGSGPFVLKTVEVSGSNPENRQEIIALEKNPAYHRGGPELDRFVLRVFRNSSQLLDAFNQHEINAAVGLTASDIDQTEGTITTYNIPQTSAVMVFLNNSSELLKDVKVRQALTQATDTKAVLASVGYPLIEVTQPLLRGQVGYDAKYSQLSFDTAAANKLLDEAGWVKGQDGIRVKDGTPLKIRLYSQSLAEYAQVVQKLQEQWRAVGVDTDAILQPEEDLQTGALARHDYDALLYGIAIGPDSDVFPYWHSSQADPRSQTRLNFSEFKNKTADESLEAARTRSNPELRAVKYRAFLDTWKNQAPAIALYQPRFYYVVRGNLSGFGPLRVNTAADRFRNVHLWTIKQELAPSY